MAVVPRVGWEGGESGRRRAGEPTLLRQSLADCCPPPTPTHPPNPPSQALAPKLPQRTCGGAVPTALPTRLASWTPRGVTSAPLACKCAKDPILKLPQW